MSKGFILDKHRKNASLNFVTYDEVDYYFFIELRLVDQEGNQIEGVKTYQASVLDENFELCAEDTYVCRAEDSSYSSSLITTDARPSILFTSGEDGLAYIYVDDYVDAVADVTVYIKVELLDQPGMILYRQLTFTNGGGAGSGIII